MIARISNAHHSYVLLGLTGLLLTGLASLAHADTPSYSVTGYNIEPAFGDYTLGYSFTPTQNIVVTALGEWVPFGGTINASEEAGIFDGNGDLLFRSTFTQANATITSNTLPGGSEFRYVDITSLYSAAERTLLAGNSYTMAATIGNNSTGTNSISLTPGPDITITATGLYNIGDTISGASPLTPSNSNVEADYGVNFEYTPGGVAATPEPGTWALLGGLTTCGLSLVRRRRQKAA